jgi:GUN4-like
LKALKFNNFGLTLFFAVLNSRSELSLSRDRVLCSRISNSHFQLRFIVVSRLTIAASVAFCAINAIAVLPLQAQTPFLPIAQISPDRRSPLPSVILTSERGINYAPLQELLRAGKWIEANQLTSQLVLQLANQQQRGYLIASDTRKLPCTDLKTLDRLWLYYSDFHFGFSVQAWVWNAIGGRTFEDSLWFESMVGWSQAEIANPGLDNTPQGYFPYRPAYRNGIRNSFGGGWIEEMPRRLKSCNAQ